MVADAGLRFIKPDKPVQNAYVESFNGKFRDECLDENWFVIGTSRAVVLLGGGGAIRYAALAPEL